MNQATRIPIPPARPTPPPVRTPEAVVHELRHRLTLGTGWTGIADLRAAAWVGEGDSTSPTLIGVITDLRKKGVIEIRGGFHDEHGPSLRAEVRLVTGATKEAARA